ncbi:hypothetical protein FB451DRAFT_1028536, partial [Mycena latifolia]
VCQQWNHLVRVADIEPTRLALLDLYKETIRFPFFTRTQPWVLLGLREFDPQRFVEVLLEHHNFIPKDFRLWILEWPARAMLFSPWPGLPEYPLGEGDGGLARPLVHNFLGRGLPLVETVYLDLSQ